MKKKLKRTTVKNQQQMENIPMKKSASSHDRFFKGAYSRPEFVLEIFELIFSKEEFNACNWEKLKTEKDSFKDKRADLVFSVPLKKTPKTNLRIFILLKHKSSYALNFLPNFSTIRPISMNKPLKNLAIRSLLSLLCSIMGRQLGNGNSLSRRLFLESFFRRFLLLFGKIC